MRTPVMPMTEPATSIDSAWLLALAKDLDGARRDLGQARAELRTMLVAIDADNPAGAKLAAGKVAHRLTEAADEVRGAASDLREIVGPENESQAAPVPPRNVCE